MSKNLSATDLKNKVSEVLNLVYFGKTTAIIERYGKPIAKIVPLKASKKGESDLEKAWKASFGSLPDFPDVTKFRRPRRKSISL